MVLINQNDFSHGELDPRMLSKSNLELYKKGAQRVRNLFVTPIGAVQRRAGLLYQDDLGSLGDEVMFAEFIYSDDISYLLIFTNLNIAVYRDGVFKVNIVSPYPGLLLSDLELRWSQTENIMTITHPDYNPRELSRGADDVTWTLASTTFKNLPGYDFKQNYDSNQFKLSVVTVGTGRTLTAQNNIFDASYVGGYFEAYGKDLSDRLGVAKITAFSDAKNVTVEITSEFSSALTNFISGSNVYLAEPAFSAIRGYPISVTYYEGRRYFGGTKSLPHSIFGSQVDDFRNYDIGTGQADEAVQETIGGHKIGIIKHILGDRSLQIFTSRSEYTVGQAQNRAITPETFSVQKQSSNGVENPRPIVLDNQTFFVKRGGKGVMSYLYDDNSQAYNSLEVSLLAPHLIRNPVDSAVLSGSSTDNANYMFLINDDGTLAVYQSVLDQRVSAWSLCETVNTTSGKFKRCIEIDDTIYFAVERTVNGSTKTYLEKLSFDAYTDSAVLNQFGSPTSVITGLGHLEGETVKVRGDGYVLADKVVQSGQITLDTPRTTVEVGLGFSPLLTPNPLAFDTGNGNNMYARKKYDKVYIDYYESLGILVDDVEVPYLTFGPDVLDRAPDPKTGVYEYSFILEGWDARYMFSISQNQPLPMTIIGLGFDVK
jgi:hypothetical protein